MTDIFIRSYHKDFQWLVYAVQSLHKYATGFRDIIIAVPQGEAQYLQGITTEKVIEVEKWEDDYLCQQADKLEAYKYTDAEFIFMWDSDLLAKEPITPNDYIEGGKPIMYKTRYEKAGTAICWKEIVDKALKVNDGWERMRRHGMIFHRDTLKALDLYIQLLHGKTVREYIKEQPYRKFSEFNVANCYAEMFESGKYTFIDTESIEMPPEKLKQFWSFSGVEKNIGEINSILYPDLKKIVEEYKTTPSDINEHLDTLTSLAQGLNVVEFGTRNGISTAALLLGAKSLISYDIEPSKDISVLNGLSYNFKFIQADDLEIEPVECDMLFIDSFHHYQQLFEELKRHAGGVKKYIVMHDVVMFGYSNQVIPEGKISNLPPTEKQGLVPAINDFLVETEEGMNWYRKSFYTYNNGLCVLERMK